MTLMPRPYARTLLILLRDRYSMRTLAQRTGLDVRVLYKLYNGSPTTWSLAIQSQLESMVPTQHARILAAQKENPRQP